MVPLVNSKSRLAILLSQLKDFSNPDAKIEQYPMDSEIGAEMLWNAYFLGDIEGKIIGDLGCGTGILGIGALLLGAKVVYMVDIDPEAVSICKENLEQVPEKEKGMLFNMPISDFRKNVETVIQNPPFGTKEKHADREFLLKAFSLAKVVYSFHKATSRGFVEKISQEHGFAITHYCEFKFPIKASMLFHTKPIFKTKVGCWRMERRQ
ncbi:50S ribosomal protein L11 methyltransferase [Candidatus Woesearchaeota archaeon]|nr:50S ribosomal protein L11 methyltransferase [Candidatus Woesearchaeota archaeon]